MQCYANQLRCHRHISDRMSVSFKNETSFIIEGENVCSTPIKTTRKDTLTNCVVNLPQLSETIPSTTASDKMISSYQSDIENCLDYDPKTIETTFIFQESPSKSFIDKISFEKTPYTMDKNIPAANDWIVCET